MKIHSLNSHLKRNPHLSESFEKAKTSEEKFQRSSMSRAGLSQIVTKGELQDKNIMRETALRNSSGFFNAENSPSFKGKNFDKFLSSKWLHKVLKFAGDNAAIFEAASALVVAGMIRPATILALPASERDKKKNQKTAAHSISSAVMGLLSTTILFKPITNVVDTVVKKPEDFGIKKSDLIMKSYKVGKDEITNLSQFGKFMGYVPKIAFAPLTTYLTIAAMPYIDKYVLSKVLKTNNYKMNAQDVYKSTSFKSETKNSEMTPQEIYMSTSFKSDTKGNNVEMTPQDVYMATSFKAFRDLQPSKSKAIENYQYTPSEIYMATSFKAGNKSEKKGGNV